VPPVIALRGISFAVRAGEVFGLVGPNGSGKTTLIKILAGLLRPTSGSGEVAGVSLREPRRIRPLVSYVSTTGWMGLEWPLTAQENVRFFAALCGMPTSLAHVRAESALRDVGLWEDRHKYPSQLSNGMRQRVILARALLLHTPLVLLDEPTVGLDPLNTRAILDLIRGPLRERGQTILLSDHQSTVIEGVADRVAVLRSGEVAMLGTPAEIRGRLAHLQVIEISTEEMDLPELPAPGPVVAAEHVERPGPLGLRTWRIHARREDGALEAVLDWITQPRGRVVFLGQSAPTFHDALALRPEEMAPWVPLDGAASPVSSDRLPGDEVEAR